MRIAVIPARGGSKRIFKKNIKTFIDKPIIAYSIQAAIDSNLFDRVIVSSDDNEIIKIANDYGAETPFIRPKNLSDDFTSVTDVIAHAIRWTIDDGWDVSEACCIYGTAPFIEINDIKKGYQNILSGRWQYAFSVTEYTFPIFRSFSLNIEGGVEMFYPENFEKRSQDLPISFHDAGQFYWGTCKAWLEKKRIFEPHSCPIIIPNWRSQDIDTMDDWKRAELIWNALNQKKS